MKIKKMFIFMLMALIVLGITVAATTKENTESFMGIKKSIIMGETLRQQLSAVDGAQEKSVRPDSQEFKENLEKQKEVLDRELTDYYSNQNKLKDNIVKSIYNYMLSQVEMRSKVIDGGAKDLKVISSEMGDNTARVEAEITSFVTLLSSGQADDPKETTTEVRTKHIYNMIKEDGIWKIAKDEWEFLPNEGP